MKLTLGFASVLAAAGALAQMPPAPIPPHDVPRVHTNYQAQVPRDADKVAPAASNAELTDLMRKQTEAIQALHGKVKELEVRVQKLEKGAR